MSLFPNTSADRRLQMIEQQLRARGIQDERVLRAMERIPREQFVLSDWVSLAYDDRALPAGAGQTISQPYIVGFMTERLRLEPSSRLLEIGTGTGYQTAIAALLCAHVYTIERVELLAETAVSRLRDLRIGNISFRVGDGTLGWPEQAPFDRILVTAGGPAVPAPLVDQLAEDGRMVIPIGPEEDQVLVLVQRVGGRVIEERLLPCRFVRLVGEAGWSEDGSGV